MEIQYNIPIEVTANQYRQLMSECSGIVAGRTENGKYFIRVWWMRYVQKILEK